MASLQETIIKNRQQLTSPQQDPQLSEKQKLDQLRSGMLGTGSLEPSRKSQSETSTQDLNAANLQQVGQQLANQSLGEEVEAEGQKEKFQQATQSLLQARNINERQLRLDTDKLLSELSRERGSLDLQRDQSKLEQVAFNLALQDKQYVQDLEEVGVRRRLNDKLAFQKEMEDVTFGDSVNVLRQKLGNESILNANDRDFRRAMSQMSIDDARELAAIAMQDLEGRYEDATNAKLDEIRSGARQANTEAKWKGISDLGSAGVKGYETYSEGRFSSEYQDYKDNGGTKSYTGWKNDPQAQSDASRLRD